MCQYLRLWYLSQKQPTMTKTNLCKCTVTPELCFKVYVTSNSDVAIWNSECPDLFDENNHHKAIKSKITKLQGMKSK